MYLVNKKFPKTEKLKSTKTIETLFSEGKTYTKFPIKVFFLPNKEINTNLAAFAVPKRNFKSAVDRNRVKRQLREAYRLNKYLIEESENTRFMMLFLYLGKVKPEYVQLEKSMLKLLKKLQEDNS
ncbi:ribonuclease P protein component [Aequorivita sp. KMM 9714]|nr:ribonuclease P protein component [Aequorivita sp. KMM 9714]